MPCILDSKIFIKKTRGFLNKNCTNIIITAIIIVCNRSLHFSYNHSKMNFLTSDQFKKLTKTMNPDVVAQLLQEMDEKHVALFMSLLKPEQINSLVENVTFENLCEIIKTITPEKAQECFSHLKKYQCEHALLPSTSIKIKSSDKLVVPQHIVIVDGSGSITFTDAELGHGSPNKTTRREDLISTLENCMTPGSKIYFFGQPTQIDERNPHDNKLTAQLLRKMNTKAFYDSCTYPQALAHTLETLSVDPQQKTVTIMTDGIFDFPGISYIVDCLKRLGQSESSITHIVLWIAKFVKPETLKIIEDAYFKIQSAFENNCIRLTLMYSDKSPTDDRHNLMIQMPKLLEPVSSIPMNCQGINSNVFWRTDATITEIAAEITSSGDTGLYFLSGIYAFVQSLITNKHFPMSDIYGKLYKIIAFIQKSDIESLKMLANKIMKEIMDSRQDTQSPAAIEFWKRVIEESVTGVSIKTSKLPKLVTISKTFVHFDENILDADISLAIRDGSGKSLQELCTKILSSPCSLTTLDNSSEMIRTDYGLPIPSPICYGLCPEMKFDCISHFLALCGKQQIVTGTHFFLACLYLVYGKFDIPEPLFDVAKSILNDIEWVINMIYDDESRTTLRAALLAPSNARMLYCLVCDSNIELDASMKEHIKANALAANVKDALEAVKSQQFKFQVPSLNVVAKEGDIITLKPGSWGKTEKPFPQIPDVLELDKKLGEKYGHKYQVKWCDNGSTYRADKNNCQVIGRNVPEDVKKKIRTLMHTWSLNDRDEERDEQGPYDIDTRMAVIIELLEPHVPAQIEIIVTGEIVNTILSASFPILCAQGITYMERCRRVAESKKNFLEPQLSSKKFVCEGNNIPQSIIEQIISAFQKKLVPPITAASTSFMCYVCMMDVPIYNKQELCTHGHNMCENCLNDLKESDCLKNSTIDPSVFSCGMCRDPFQEPLLLKLNLDCSMISFIQSEKFKDEKNVYKKCTDCPVIFNAGPKSCADDGAELPSQCEIHRKRTDFPCPLCGIKFQHDGGCSLMRCCFKPDEHGERGYHSCHNDSGQTCNHCCVLGCDDFDCEHMKGCGHSFIIGEDERQVGNTNPEPENTWGPRDDWWEQP